MSAKRSEARQQAAAEMRRQAERDKRRRLAGILAAALVSLAVLGGLVLAATNKSNEVAKTPTLNADVTTPKGLTDGALVTGKADAKVAVTVYEDLQCPACKAFEAATGPALKELVDAGTIKIERRPIAFLDRQSTTEYSSRAMNAVGCVIEQDPKSAEPFISALYKQQPAEGGAGLPDASLVKIAADSGAEGIGSCVGGRTFAPWVKAATEASTKAGVKGTPTVLVDGKALKDNSPESVRAAVEAAASA